MAGFSVRWLLTSILLTVAAVWASAVLAMWVTDRQLPTQTLAIDIDPAPVRPGDQVSVKYDVIRHRVCTTWYDQSIKDAVGYRWDFASFQLDVRPQDIGEEKRAVAVRVPEHAAPGRAVYRNLRRYYCNPLQRLLDWPIVTVSQDVPFTISAP